ncbi:hypothetical protein EV359DRAFT_78373 [Lentinula novae-zelandiae]|nr:hypothetical protein EV359DRAFT_78373 [Lentinula novae-zelandiae]
MVIPSKKLDATDQHNSSYKWTNPAILEGVIYTFHLLPSQRIQRSRKTLECSKFAELMRIIGANGTSHDTSRVYDEYAEAIFWLRDAELTLLAPGSRFTKEKRRATHKAVKKVDEVNTLAKSLVKNLRKKDHQEESESGSTLGSTEEPLQKIKKLKPIPIEYLMPMSTLQSKGNVDGAPLFDPSTKDLKWEDESDDSTDENTTWTSNSDDEYETASEGWDD